MTDRLRSCHVEQSDELAHGMADDQDRLLRQQTLARRRHRRADAQRAVGGASNLMGMLQGQFCGSLGLLMTASIGSTRFRPRRCSRCWGTTVPVLASNHAPVSAPQQSALGS